MSKRQTPLYQGRDWFSYRWAVAQAFDSLEHIHDLCLCHTTDDRFDEQADPAALTTYFHDLGEVLGAQLSTVYADTIPQAHSISDLQQRWCCVEARQTYATLHQTINAMPKTGTAELDQIISLSLTLKDQLRKIDI